MSRILLHDWEPSLKNLSVEISKITEDIYNTAYARGKKYSDVTEVLDKIRAEITAITINGQVDEYTMFIRSGERVKQMALDIIDKYKAESEGKE